MFKNQKLVQYISIQDYFVKSKKKKSISELVRSLECLNILLSLRTLFNLLLEYLMWYKLISFYEVILQLVIIYNLIQLFKQVNFFFTLAYFLNLVVFVGLSMIFFDLELGAIILWVIYGGVIIIFFLYATMWSETVKTNLFFFDYRLAFFLFYIYIFYCFISLVAELEFMTQYGFIRFVGVYNFLGLDSYEEFEMLGASFFFFSLFFFILCTIALVVSCFSIVVIILTLKKLKAQAFVSYMLFNQKYLWFSQVIILKNQHFFNQEYDSTYLQNSTSRIYKISVKFHRNKVNYRRI